MRKLLSLVHSFLVAVGICSRRELVAQEDGFCLPIIDDGELK